VRLIELAYQNPYITIVFLVVISWLLEELIREWKEKD
jgi:hypothetical protein